MSTQFRVTFGVTRGQHPEVWDEIFDSGVITTRNLAVAQAEANALLPKAIGRHRESTEDPMLEDDDIKDCRATVEPLSAWVRRGLQNCEEIRGWTPEEQEDA